MKRFLLFLLCICYYISPINAQAPYWTWAKHAGGINYDRATAIMLNSDNNLMVAGYFLGTAYFPTDTITPVQYNAMFMAAYTRNGDMLWVRDVAECEGAIEPKYIFQDSVGDYTMVGIFGSYTTGGTIHFSPTDSFTSAGNGDIFVAKFDTSGTFIWAQAIRSTEDVSTTFVASMDKTGNLYVAGNMFADCIFTAAAPDTLISDSYWHIYIAKYLSGGTVVAANKMITSGIVSYPTGMVANFDDNIYLTGKYIGNPVFGIPPDTFSLPGSVPYDDIFLSKFSASGTHTVWAVNPGGASDDYTCSLDAGKTGNLVMTGTYTNGIRFRSMSGTDSLTAPTSGGELFVAEYDTSGAFHWAKNAGYSPGGGIVINNTCLNKDSGKLCATGNYTSYPSFGEGTHLTPISVADGLFVAQYGDSGTLNWVQVGGGGSYSIIADDSGSAFIAGSFNLGTIFETDSIHGDTLYSYGYDDILVAKLGGARDTGTVTSITAYKDQPLIKLYPNPSHTQIFLETKNIFASEMRITNILGAEILKRETTTQKFESIDVSRFASGIYFISLKGDGKVYSLRFVKE